MRMPCDPDSCCFGDYAPGDVVNMSAVVNVSGGGAEPGSDDEDCCANLAGTYLLSDSFTIPDDCNIPAIFFQAMLAENKGCFSPQGNPNLPDFGVTVLISIFPTADGCRVSSDVSFGAAQGNFQNSFGSVINWNTDFDCGGLLGFSTSFDEDFDACPTCQPGCGAGNLSATITIS